MRQCCFAKRQSVKLSPKDLSMYPWVSATFLPQINLILYLCKLMHWYTIGQSDGGAFNPKENIYFQGSEDIWKKRQNGREGLL